MIKLYHGNCLEILPTLPENSVDSIVTDPPYELGFMGKGWDGSGVAFEVKVWIEALRVLKPGGHLLAFGGSRTYHRLACAVEDAGFEIRDQIMWLYGSGFPKSLNVSKAVDKAAGAEREVVGPNPNSRPNMVGVEASVLSTRVDAPLSLPATAAAKQWDGWGTALKPAHEPIVVARKPLIGTVVANVLEYGTGALNIDGCRVGPGDPVSGGGNNFDAWREGEDRTDRPKQHGSSSEGHNNGRWPANIIHDGSEEVLVHFPDALGQQGDLVNHDKDRKSPNGCFGKMAPAKDHVARGDSGTAARFFYCAKASKKDRGEGNKHPTVKPQALMRYLVRLVTPPKGVVLDPFAGSFSTGLAAREEGFSFIGVEKEEEYYEYGKKRMGETETMIDWLEELEVGTK